MSFRAQEVMAQEIRALRAVQGDDTFPQLIGVIKRSYLVSFAMEFIGDWNTYKTCTVGSELIKPGSFSRENWLKIAIDIGQGLKTLHGKGFIHCDLHTYNVLICKPPESTRPRAKLIDLGQAIPRSNIAYLDLSPPEKDHTYKTCTHLAPELIEGETFYTVQSDIYAYGRTINCIATYQSMADLLPLSEAAMSRNPMDRCTIGYVLRGLNKLLQDGTGFW